MICLLSLVPRLRSNFACKIRKILFFPFPLSRRNRYKNALRRYIILLDICNLKVRNYSSSLSIYKRLIPRFRTSITRRDDPSISPARVNFGRTSIFARCSTFVNDIHATRIDFRSIDRKNVRFYRRAVDFDC